MGANDDAHRLDPSIYSHKVDIEEPYTMAYQQAAIFISLNTLDLLVDPMVQPGSDAFISRASQVGSSFTVKLETLGIETYVRKNLGNKMISPAILKTIGLRSTSPAPSWWCASAAGASAVPTAPGGFLSDWQPPSSSASGRASSTSRARLGLLFQLFFICYLLGELLLQRDQVLEAREFKRGPGFEHLK